MFDSLSERLQGVFGELRGHGKLSEADIDKAMREIRLALLEADVNFKVVREFVSHVKERALGAEVMESLTPAQQVVKIVERGARRAHGRRRLAPGLQRPAADRHPARRPAGLGQDDDLRQARPALLKKDGKRPVLVAADVYRPAAIDQLVTLAERVGVPVYAPGADVDPVDIARDGVDFAREKGDVAIIDTAGRLHIDDELMEELVRIRKAGQAAQHPARRRRHDRPGRGQRRRAVQAARRHRRRDPHQARRRRPRRRRAVGARRHRQAHQVREHRREARRLRLVPPRPHGLAHPRHGRRADPDREGQSDVDEQEAARMEERLRRADFTFEDFLEQLKQVRKMGSLSSILGMLPGVPGMKELKNAQVDDRQLDRIEAIIFSMTPEERRHPDLIDGSRRQRIARGSGTQVADVNRLLKQFREMQKMLKQMAGPKGGLLGKLQGSAGRVTRRRRRRRRLVAGRRAGRTPRARCDIMTSFGARGAPHVRLWEEVMSWPFE